MSDLQFLPGKNEARTRLGAQFDDLHIDTKLSTSRNILLKNVDPVIVPIYHSSTYKFRNVDQWNEYNHGLNYVYQRCGNPTVENVEVIINEMEGGAATLAYNSGLAAISAVLLEFLCNGDHVVCMKPLYSGSYSFMIETMSRFGVSFTFVDIEKENNFCAAVRNAIKENTKMVYMEVIANPSMAVPNLLEVLEITDQYKVYSFVDATFASPYNVQPIKLGADFSMHSCSKYIGGHTDVIGGCVTVKKRENWQRLKVQQLTTGSAISPFDAALLARGLKTLALRVDKISDNALVVAEFLSSHPKVEQIYYPGLPSHKGFEAAKKFMRKFGGMIGFDMGTAEKAIKVVENVRLIGLAVSLGGTESLIEHPCSMSHGNELLRNIDEPMVSPGLIRLSVGVENVADLIADLDNALSIV